MKVEHDFSSGRPINIDQRQPQISDEVRQHIVIHQRRVEATFWFAILLTLALGIVSALTWWFAQ